MEKCKLISKISKYNMIGKVFKRIFQMDYLFISFKNKLNNVDIRAAHIWNQYKIKHLEK